MQIQRGGLKPAFDINRRFWCHDGNQFTEPMGVGTGYINNFHTSRYSGERNGSREQKARGTGSSKFVGQLLLLLRNIKFLRYG